MTTRVLARVTYLLYLGVFLSFLYVPLAVVGILAFNNSALPQFPWQGFTLRWFRAIAADPLLLRAVANSVIVGAAVVALAAPIGVITAFLLVRYRFPGKNLLYTLVLSPLVTPGVILGVSMLIFFDSLGVQAGLATAVLGQTSFIASFVLLIAAARLQKFDRSLEEAAQDLGATPLRAVLLITLPFLRPAVMAACVVAFLLSFDNFNTTFFLIGNEITLPIRIYTTVRLELSPTINAISVVFILLTVTMGMATELLRRRAST
ncbi:MAG: ABC transporter permease [Armatimonadetes bacterium]|nr:ABC transporter permease [Armatimonadota bacterium]